MINTAQQLLLNVTLAHIKHYYYITHLRIFNNDNLFLPSIKTYQQSCKNAYEKTRFFVSKQLQPAATKTQASNCR
jgi:hypothetical protein